MNQKIFPYKIPIIPIITSFPMAASSSSSSPSLEASSQCKTKLVQSYKEIIRDKSLNFTVVPDTSDILIWYIIFRGSVKTDYEGGQYILKLFFPFDYPLKPPNIEMMTPSGRFEINTKICISSTGYHTDEWSPLIGPKEFFIGFESIMNDENEKGIGHIKTSPTNRKKLALESREYNKAHYPDIIGRMKKII